MCSVRNNLKRKDGVILYFMILYENYFNNLIYLMMWNKNFILFFNKKVFVIKKKC